MNHSHFLPIQSDSRGVNTDLRQPLASRLKVTVTHSAGRFLFLAIAVLFAAAPQLALAKPDGKDANRPAATQKSKQQNANQNANQDAAQNQAQAQAQAEARAQAKAQAAQLERDQRQEAARQSRDQLRDQVRAQQGGGQDPRAGQRLSAEERQALRDQLRAARKIQLP